MFQKIFTLIVLTATIASATTTSVMTGGDVLRDIESSSVQRGMPKKIDQSKNKKAIIESLDTSMVPEAKGENQLIDEQSFTLRSFSLLGATKLKKDDVMAIIKPLLDQKIAVSKLSIIADQITALYKKAGYIGSKCIVPPQEIKNGKLILKAIESKIFDVIIQGSADYNERIFKRVLNDLKGKVITISELNERMAKLAYMPVAKVKPRLVKTSNEEYLNLILYVEDKFDDQFSVMYDQYGSESTGKNRITLNGRIANVTGNSDLLNIRVLTTDNTKRLNSTNIQYITPTKSGGSLSFTTSISQYQLDPFVARGSDTVIDEGSSTLFGLSYSAPANISWLSKYPMTVTTSLQNINVSSDVLENKTGESLIAKNDINTILGGNILMYQQDRFGGLYSLNFGIKQGLEGVLNSMTKEDIQRTINDFESDTGTGNGTQRFGTNIDPSFTIFTYGITRQQKLFDTIDVSLSLSGQYSASSLPDVMRYPYAGQGDSGYLAQLAVSRTFFDIISIGIAGNYASVKDYDLNGDHSLDEIKSTSGLSTNISFNKGFDYDGYQLNLNFSENLIDSTKPSFYWSIGKTW